MRNLLFTLKVARFWFYLWRPRHGILKAARMTWQEIRQPIPF